MATLTITIADDKVPLVMAAVGAYNDEHGTTLTAPQWAKRVLAEELLRGELSDLAANLSFQYTAQLRQAHDALVDGA